ncbi:zinc finger protein Noc-like isoform X2 [Artemia franciscana]|nr:hypothetical protein QYM36_000057 [Artemia franciscana]KAK2725427.1 hypothetical protein QYM36_000057 [Artemia franciscana]
MDSKTSPLALLAQTCNQIGADITPVKSLEKPKNFDKDSKKCSSPTTGRTTSEKKEDDRQKTSQSPSSQKADVRSSSSRPTSSQANEQKLPTPSGDPLDAYRMMGLSAAYNPFGAYAGLDPAAAAALGVGLPMRSPYPFPGYPTSQLHGLGLAIPTSMSQLSAAAMLNYARPKPTECRDPYCTTCPPTQHASASNSVCPLGCAQCDHPKVPIPSTTPANQTVSAPSERPSTPKPYVCNWVAGTDYCGKKFVSSDELLQHLRTHTSSSGEPSTSYSSTLAAAAAANPLLSRGYPHLSHLAAASRYHPYAKPSPLSSPSGMSLPNLTGYPGASSTNSHPMFFGSGLSPFAGLPGSANHMALGHLGSLSPSSSLQSLGLGSMPPSFGLGSSLPTHPALASYYSSQLSLYGQRP